MKDKMGKKESIKGKKGAIAIDELLKWLLGAFILVIVIVAIVLLSGKGQSALGYMKDIFRFGGK